jgi:hypothetical protein
VEHNGDQTFVTSLKNGDYVLKIIVQVGIKPEIGWISFWALIENIPNKKT